MSNANKLILASSSSIRATLLKNAGINFCIDPPNIDEHEILLKLIKQAKPISEIAITLATMKANLVSGRWRDHMVIGADQTLDIDGQLFTKPKNSSEAKKTLIALRGTYHRLTSSVSVTYNREVMWSDTSTSTLKMRSFSAEFLDKYLLNAGTGIFKTVGGYEIEKLGIQLFEDIKGDYHAILGLPLIPLLNFLINENRPILFDN